MSCKTIFHPTYNQLLEIQKWLIKEKKDYEQSFINNWSIIDTAFNNNELVIIKKNNFVVGFVVYQVGDLIMTIDILSIMPSHRNNGIGRKIIDDLFRKLTKQGVLVAKLFCMPEKSETFWRKIGFMNYPKFPYNNERIRMYKPLISVSEINKKNDIPNQNEIIELWDNEPHKAQKPKWNWKLNFIENSRLIENPIIFPAHYDWQICWKNGNTIMEKDKIKYFKSENIEYQEFIIIRKLIKH